MDLRICKAGNLKKTAIMLCLFFWILVWFIGENNPIWYVAFSHLLLCLGWKSWKRPCFRDKISFYATFSQLCVFGIIYLMFFGNIIHLPKIAEIVTFVGVALMTKVNCMCDENWDDETDGSIFVNIFSILLFALVTGCYWYSRTENYQILWFSFGLIFYVISSFFVNSVVCRIGLHCFIIGVVMYISDFMVYFSIEEIIYGNLILGMFGPFIAGLHRESC